MKQVMHYLRTRKIRQQILIAMIAVSLCSTVFLGTVVYSVSKYIIERNYKMAHTYNLEVSSNIMDIQLDNIIELARNMLLDEDLMDLLEETELVNQAAGDKRFATVDSLKLNKILGETAGQDERIEGISIVSNSGRALFYYKRVRSGSFSDFYGDRQIIKEPWIQEAEQKKGLETFYGYDVLLSQNQPYFCLTKNLIHPYSGKSMGYMVISIRQKLFNKAFGKNGGLYETNRSMVIDRNGVKPVVYDQGDDKDLDKIANSYISGQKSGTYLFSSSYNATTGWEMVNVIERSELSRDGAYIGGITGVVIAVLVLVSLQISRWISERINRPLGKLEMVIDEVGEGNRHIEASFDDGEIGRIGNKFKTMVNHNLELRERLLSSQLNEREAELLLLQAQINPHFLYNTLDSLYCMAVIDHNDNIADMVASLSHIFRLSLNQGEKFIRVEDELMHIREYMAIQNMRFQNRFALIWEIEEGIGSLYMIKFILQPFVENAMYHGLEPKIGKGRIRISGKIGEALTFEIEDDGMGIPDLHVLENGYGVRNVRERIQLFCGEGYGVWFASEVGKGTKVTIRIPVWETKGGLLHEEISSN